MSWYWIEHVALVLVLFLWIRSFGKVNNAKEKLKSHLENNYRRTFLSKGVIITKYEVFDKKTKYGIFSEELDQAFELTLPFEGHIGEVVGIDFLRIKETNGDPFVKSRSKYWFTQPLSDRNSFLIDFVYMMDGHINSVNKYYTK